MINGTAAGGGYELALATDHIMLVDDGSSAVSLPELPLLAVLPGTGGLTRVTDKRKVRRDRADVFCTTEEGIKGRRAVDWRLVDEVVPSSRLEEAVAKRAREFTARSSRPAAGKGIALTPLKRERSADAVEYSTLSVEFERASRRATITLRGPEAPPPASAEAMVDAGAQFWPLRLVRELDDAILDIRANEFDTAAIIFKSSGDPAQVLAYDQFLEANKKHWLAREIRAFWKRVLKRVDLTSRSLVALVELGSCFAGTLAEHATTPRLGAAVTVPRVGILRASYSRYYQHPQVATIEGPVLGFALKEGLAMAAWGVGSVGFSCSHGLSPPREPRCTPLTD